jgi:hypothetical protein
MEPLRRSLLAEMVGAPGTLLVYSRLLSVLHPLLRFPIVLTLLLAGVQPHREEAFSKTKALIRKALRRVAAKFC